MRNQPDKAVAIYRQSVSASNDERLVIYLALLYEQLKRIDDAVALYDEKLKQTPTSASLNNNLAILLATHHQDSASKDRALQLVKKFEVSDNPHNLDTLGWVYYLRSEYDQAINTLLQAEKLSPNVVTIQYHLAFTYFAKGNHDMARKYLQTVIKAEPAFAKRQDVVQIMEKLKIT